MNAAQMDHYKQKLAFETDAWDLKEALDRGDPVVVIDGEGAEARAGTEIACGC